MTLSKTKPDPKVVRAVARHKYVDAVSYGRPLVVSPIGIIPVNKAWACEPINVKTDQLGRQWLNLKVWTPACMGKANYYPSWNVATEEWASAQRHHELEIRQPDLLVELTTLLKERGAEWSLRLIKMGGGVFASPPAPPKPKKRKVRGGSGKASEL